MISFINESQNVKDAVKRATIRLEITCENIAGVMLPEMHIREVDDSDSSMNQIGLDRGGQAIQRCRDKFKDLLIILVKIASL
jgi:V-type H+-transporting ATPase subunit D